MILSRYSNLALIVISGGSVAWLAKIAVIVATAGRVTDTGAAAIFMLLGLALLVLGTAGLGLHFTVGRAWLLRLSAAILSPALFILSYLLLDTLARHWIQSGMPAYWREEAGILLTASCWLLFSVGAIVSQY